LRELPAEQEAKLLTILSARSGQHDPEMVENCAINFMTEIVFEHFRRNYAYEEAEEIRMEFDKICTWFKRVEEHDWFGAPTHEEARGWLRRSESLLEDFEASAFELNATDDNKARVEPRLLLDDPAGCLLFPPG